MVFVILSISKSTNLRSKFSFRSDIKQIQLFNFIGGPAESAGLKPGDCILEINGINVRYESFCHFFHHNIQSMFS